MNRKHKGFTLIEVLLALFITAILITILSIVFNTGLRSYRQGKDLLEITRKGQLVLGQITRELESAMAGPHIIFEGEPNALFFMAPLAINDRKLDLCEVGYLYDDGEKELIRHYYTYWNENESRRNPGFEYPENEVVYGGGRGIRNIFCDRITGFSLRYHNDDGWLSPDSQWPDAPKLPRMVGVSVTIQGKYGNPLQARTFRTWIYLPNSTNNP